MELVYLWVEDYKNIQKQGFNFSPRFECEYVDNELTIIEKKEDEYIKDFFGENINVTAIVGKNGSGKSSVLNFVRLFLEEKYRIEKKAILIFHNRKNEFIPFTLNYGNDLLKFKSKDIENYNNDILKEENALIDTIFPFFDYSLTYEKSDSSRRRRKLEGFISKGKEKNDDKNKREVEKKLVKIFPKFPKKDGNSLNFFREDMDNLTKIIANYKVIKSKKIFEDFFTPSQLVLTISKSKIREKFKKTSKKTIVENIGLIESIETKGVPDPTLNVDTFLFFNKLNKHFDTNELLESYASEILNEVQLEALHEKGDKSINIIGNIGSYQHDIMKFNISDLEKNEIKYLLELAKTEMFKVSLLDEKGKSLENLSFGEQQLLKILNIVYYLANNNENIIFFFDEIDIGLHPEWQKKIFKYIIDVLLQFPEKNFHLILSSHSPFLLSDIPKENILFIKDQLEHKQTFGANIHTLLSDSFFMEDGLMGEFAKEKINEIIAFFNNENELYKNDKDKLLKIINTIGEPFLKDKLLFMYNEEYPKTDDEKILELEKQIESIKNGRD
ncbi:MAG: Unknown protein [uncultured Sulfurovum sp.]|uniref:Endonuclease GajA/Old nuclease/RecF-like AAA domain-containing protein n=1 Tax=uncultured Sulfurovum sp. TaxID=269237 RepID=A0A6S6T007_9BACT|nr:MAG: Unknown protein [uncultured Sulfurovum sp.]